MEVPAVNVPPFQFAAELTESLSVLEIPQFQRFVPGRRQKHRPVGRRNDVENEGVVGRNCESESTL